MSAVACTGVAASWCPVCGTCICNRAAGLDDPRCPLHGPGSPHPMVRRGAGLIRVCCHCRQTAAEGHHPDCAVVRIPGPDPFAMEAAP